jgi:hypothetical protein
MRLLFNIENNSEEYADIILGTLEINDEEFTIIEKEDGIVATTMEPLIFPQTISLDFAEYSGKSIDLIPELLLKGKRSKREVLVSDKTSFDVP